MGRSAGPPRLTFEDAMSVHVLRAHGVIFSDLKRLFGVNPARMRGNVAKCRRVLLAQKNSADDRSSAEP